MIGPRGGPGGRQQINVMLTRAGSGRFAAGQNRTNVRQDGFFDIVGVVGNVHYQALDTIAVPTMYVPLQQDVFSTVWVVARAKAGDAAALGGVARNVLHDADPTLPAFSMSPLETVVTESVAQKRFSMLLLSLFAAVALFMLWTGAYTPKVQWTLTVLIVGVWTGCSFSVRHRVVLPLQTLSNLLAALRESDFSIRARGASGDDPLGAVMLEVNVLASTLHDQRLGVYMSYNSAGKGELSPRSALWRKFLDRYLPYTPPARPS